MNDDLGKLVLAQNFTAEYRAIYEAAEEGRPLCDIEREKLGVTHAEAGAYLLAVWGLPVGTVQAVANHHAPSETITRITPGTALHIAEQILESRRPLDEIIGGYSPEVGLFKHVETFAELMPFRGGCIQERPAAADVPLTPASAVF